MARTMVVFVGGWGTNQLQMAALSKLVPEERKVTFFLPDEFFNLVRPWVCADRLYDFVQSNLAGDSLIFVSFSLGGVVTQRMLNDHPDLPVRKLILVASPVGGYRIPPPYPFFSDDFPRDLPIYVIAGNKASKDFHLREENDGAVDVASAFSVPPDNLREWAIFPAGHLELYALPEVQTKLAHWLNLEEQLAVRHPEISGNQL